MHSYVVQNNSVNLFGTVVIILSKALGIQVHGVYQHHSLRHLSVISSVLINQIPSAAAIALWVAKEADFTLSCLRVIRDVMKGIWLKLLHCPRNSVYLKTGSI